MSKSIIWRLVIIFSVLLGWGYSLFPPKDRPFYEVLFKEVDGNADSELEKVVEEAKKIDNSNPDSFLTPPKAVLRVANESKVNLRDYIPLYNQPEASNQAVVNYVRRRAAGKLRLGLDLRGGTEFIITFDSDELEKNDPDKEVVAARDEIIEIIRNRVDQSGVVEAQILPVGQSTISLKIPSINADDVQGYREIVQATAKLDFRLVHQSSASLVAQEGNDDFTVPAAYERMEMKAAADSNEPNRVLYVNRFPESIGGRHIKRAFANVNEFGSYSISLEFNGEGAKLFYEVTKDNVGRQLAIVLDGTVYSAPNINEAISGGRAEISGNFSPEEANKLGVVLRCGNLPVPISIEGEFSTDPTLGKDSVKSGAYAALAGLVLVVLFMLIYYFTAGFIADLALAANILLVLGTLTIAGATITLPGIAGIVLTIGMAIDANVLIFERIREEFANKKTIANAIHTGYSRAFITILDANLTTLLTALVLYKFGSGPIRGFAVTLSIGIVASLFTSLFMTRTIFDILLWTGRIKKVRMLHIFNFGNFNFLGFRKVATIVASILILGSVLTLGIRGKSAFGVDFTGGTAVTFNYIQEVPARDIRTKLETDGYENIGVAYKSSASQDTRLMEIVLGGVVLKETDIKSDIQKILNNAFPEAKFSGGTTKMIGGLVGKRFTKQAMWAFFWSIIGIVLYITFRFEFGYAVGAVAALFHDILICTGIFLIANMANRQISLPVIAALLTVLGYSLNDTIVVFDRIRENLGLIKKKSFLEIVNLSINQTLSRTMLTSLTTLCVVLTLYFFGGGAINDFALVMLAGVLIGSYSSIYIATPVMIFWQNKRETENASKASSSLAEKPA